MTDPTDTTQETPVEQAQPAPEAAPQAAQLKVTTKKLSAKRVEAADDHSAPAQRQDGETRTDTDAGPVQMAVVTREPREIEELEFPALKITRIRY